MNDKKPLVGNRLNSSSHSFFRSSKTKPTHARYDCGARPSL